MTEHDARMARLAQLGITEEDIALAVVASRRAQGLPDHVEHGPALDRLAALITSVPRPPPEAEKRRRRKASGAA